MSLIRQGGKFAHTHQGNILSDDGQRRMRARQPRAQIHTGDDELGRVSFVWHMHEREEKVLLMVRRVGMRSMRGSR